VAGCGRSIVPVKGRVTFDGKPVTEAAVTFNPLPKKEDDLEPGKPATGYTDADGKYALSTYKNYDGALVGKHRVNIALDDTNPARCKRSKQLDVEVAPGQTEFNFEMDPR
jgi:hypothetical protein